MTFVWLASYPKSGNTWLRILLSHYLSDSGDGWRWGDPLIGPSSHLIRHEFDEAMGVASSDLDTRSTDTFRRQFHAQFVRKFTGTCFAKTHEAYLGPRDGRPMFPTDPNTKVIYLVRNPLDLVSSYAHHKNRSVDKIIDQLASPRACVENSDVSFNEHLGAWSEHVAGWTEQEDLETLAIRYEDLVANTADSFRRILDFCHLSIDTDKIQKAIEASRFERLQSQERKAGFKALADTSRSFFRRGRTGEWREELTHEQVKRIVTDHAEIMERLSYRAADAA